LAWLSPDGEQPDMVRNMIAMGVPAALTRPADLVNSRCSTVTMLAPLTVTTRRGLMGGGAMRAGTRWFKQHVVPLGLLALLGAGCSQTSNDDTADSTTTAPSVTMAGPAAFVAEARAMTFGTKDLAAASEEELLKVGKLVCDGHCPKRGAQPVPTACQHHPELTSVIWMPQGPVILSC
jgi:hypothetical protein